jgi:hypothetical protein
MEQVLNLSGGIVLDGRSPEGTGLTWGIAPPYVLQ